MFAQIYFRENYYVLLYYKFDFMRQIKYLSLLFFLFSNTLLWSQMAIGTWRDHLPYNKTIMAAEAGNRIYAATEQTLFYVDKEENSINRLTKVEGLSDVGISQIRYSESQKSLIIAYQNANVDIIKNGRVYNIPDIKRKIIPGNKSIYNIYIEDKLAYLSCGFGIISLDLKKMEIADTWLIGPQGSQIEVYDLTIYDDTFFVATQYGLYRAWAQQSNLANFNYWNIDTSYFALGTNINFINVFNNSILANKITSPDEGDSIYIYKNGEWKFENSFDITKRKSIEVYGDKILVTNNFASNEYNSDFQLLRNVWSYMNNLVDINYAIKDKENNIWICDNNLGVVKIHHEDIWTNSIFTPNGPVNNVVFKMTIADDKLAVAHGGVNGPWVNNYMSSDWSYFSDNEWTQITRGKISQLDTINDIISIAINPRNPKHIFASAWGYGILEFLDDELINVYDHRNTSLEAFYDRTYVGGLDFDEDGNLWFTNSSVGKLLGVRTPQNEWYHFNLSPYAMNVNTSTVYVDRLGYKWIILPRDNGLLVYNDKGTLSNSSDDEKKSLNINLNTKISSTEIHCLAQDLSGSMWVGTDKGIKVFYNAESIFSINNPAPQNILLEQDGYVQNLLEFENVNCIAIDGANQKWIGTSKAGVFVMSPDGTKEIHRFTESNSPLFSNTIFDIKIHPKTGEVFIATDKGIVSYRGFATQGVEKIVKEEVKVTPNPVKDGYNGYISISGLTSNANVKITDINGYLAFQTVAQGGQAVWNGKDFNGKRVATGVYLVLASDAEGQEKVVAKILFIH